MSFCSNHQKPGVELLNEQKSYLSLCYEYCTTLRMVKDRVAYMD